MGMFSQKEIILMIGVVSVLLVCITILTILDIREYLKAKKEVINEDEALENSEEAPVEAVKVIEVEDDSNVLISENKEEAYFEEMEDERYEKPEIVNPIIEEEEEVIPQAIIQEVEEQDLSKEVIINSTVVQEDNKKLDVFEELEEIENNLPNKKDDVTNFEMEQERTAIISLDELMKKSDELYNDNEVEQYDDGNEPISIDEVIKMFNKEEDYVDKIEEKKEETPIVVKTVVEEKKELYSKKETIPFISSVYGIEKKDNALEFENTATYEKLDRQNYNDFVGQLREMNENK